jgi:uncharacterized protein YjbI with pentapeptide repeats
LLLVAQLGPFPPHPAFAGTAANGCPDSPSPAAGPDFSGQNLAGRNFSGLDLRNANFSGAILKGTAFIGANLAGANFSNIQVQKSDNEELRPTDFTAATLRSACFSGAAFQGRSYFSHADISCADFSRTVLADGITIFGPTPLTIDASACKPAFRGAVMNCEFITEWPKLEFGIPAGSQNGSGTNFSACATKLAGIALPGADLSGADLQNADLTGADLRNARLQGANLASANLSGANLSGAVLSNENGRPSASLIGAHLRNVDLSLAKLSGADFSHANFYSSARGSCGGARAGRSCSSARGATMTETNFANAYLYGVDFSQSTIAGANFSGAVLTGASFANASIGNSGNGTRTSFGQAHLEGTDLGDAALLKDANLADAWFDFNPNGNLLYLSLDGSHARHACPSSGCPVARGAEVCVAMPYDGAKKAPQSEPSLICPSGLSLPSGCGPARRDGGNPAWKSGQAIAAAWYASDATYTKASPDAAVCNGKGSQATLPDW